MFKVVSWNIAAQNGNPLEYHDFLEARAFERRLGELSGVLVSDLTPPLDYMLAACCRAALGCVSLSKAETDAFKKIVESKLMHLPVNEFFFNNKSFFRGKWLNKANKEIYNGVEQPPTSIIHGGLPNGNSTIFFDTWVSVWGSRLVSRPSLYEGISPQACQLLHTLTLVIFELAVNGVVHGSDQDGVALSRALSSRVLSPRDTAARQVSFVYNLICGSGECAVITLQEASESTLAALGPLLHDDYVLISDPRPVHRNQQSVIYVNRHAFPCVALDSGMTEMLKSAVPDSVVAAGDGHVFASVHATSDGLGRGTVDQMLDILSIESVVVVIGIDANTTADTAREFLEACQGKRFDCTNKELRPTSSKSRTCLQYQLQKASSFAEKSDETPKDFILTYAATASLAESEIVYSTNDSNDPSRTSATVPRMPHAGLPSDHAAITAFIQERNIVG